MHSFIYQLIHSLIHLSTDLLSVSLIDYLIDDIPGLKETQNPMFVGINSW